MKCPHCDKEIPGTPCPNCGEPVFEGANYCMACGAPLKEGMERVSHHEEVLEDDGELDLESRVLCPDGTCTGIIVDGKCTECGRLVGAYGEFIQQETTPAVQGKPFTEEDPAKKGE